MDTTTLALLGLGSRSTSFYIRQLNKLYNEKKGGYSTCPFKLLNANFNTINPLLPNTSQQLDTIINNYILEIEKLDTEHLLIPNITLHETIDRLNISTKIIHPVHKTVLKIKQTPYTKIVLFGSLHTMESSYIRSIFKANNIQIILPLKEDRLFIDQVRKKVYSETETDELIKKYHLIIEKYTTNYPVVLACTELSILKPKEKNALLLDMAQIQITEAVKTVL